MVRDMLEKLVHLVIVARIVRSGRGIQGRVSVLVVMLKLHSIQFLPKLFSVGLQILLSARRKGN